MVTALTKGSVAERIAATNAARARLLATRKLPLTGVSMFPKPDEEPRPTRPRPAAPPRAGLVPVRDSAAFEALRDRATAAATPPQVFLACLGARRDFGGREMFTKALLGVAGIASPSSEGGTAAEIVAQSGGARFAILCSSAAVYAEQAIEVATALKKAGVSTVFIAGRKAETAAENVDAVIDGEVFDGMDVVAFLNATLDQIGGAE
jgi:methylmalonyl-CoA mutase